MIVKTKMSKKSNRWILRDQVLLLEKLVRDKSTNFLDTLYKEKKTCGPYSVHPRLKKIDKIF